MSTAQFDITNFSAKFERQLRYEIGRLHPVTVTTANVVDVARRLIDRTLDLSSYISIYSDDETETFIVIVNHDNTYGESFSYHFEYMLAIEYIMMVLRRFEQAMREDFERGMMQVNVEFAPMYSGPLTTMELMVSKMSTAELINAMDKLPDVPDHKKAGEWLKDVDKQILIWYREGIISEEGSVVKNSILRALYMERMYENRTGN
jgi:hypothetical protein